MAVWRALSGHWWILRSSDNTVVVFWGSQSLGDIAAVGDYDGDGKSDVAVWRPSDAVWYIVKSSDGNPMYLQFGLAGDVPVPAKYDSDNKTDLAVWRPSDGTWYIQQSTNNQMVTHQLSSDVARDILVPADYDGDNKADVAVWQQSNGSWTIKQSSDNQVVTKQLGATGDIAVPSSYIRRSSAPRGQSVEIPRDGLANVSYNTETNRINNTGWEYDVAGNQTRTLAQGEQSWNRFEYDAANRLVKVKDDSNNTIQSFVYGATNARLITQDGDEQSNNRTYYAADDGITIAEYVETASQPNAPTWSKSYVFAGGRLLSTTTPSGQSSETIQYHHPDRLGTRLITNANDTTVQEQVTLPFGTALESESTGSSNRRFTSYDRSNVTGLDYAVNRTYDSQQGRFTQVDPIGIEASTPGDPQSLNLYSYVGNDPINHVDPDGLFFKKLFNFFKKLLRWIFVALSIAVAVLTFVYAPALFASTLKFVLGAIGAVANATSSVLNALGFTKAAMVFGIIGAAATFGTSLIGAVEKANWKTILGAVSSGATATSQTLSAFGYRRLAQVFGIVAGATGFVSNGLKVKPDGTFGWNYSATRTVFEAYKLARSTTEQVANIVGKTRLTGFLNSLGTIDDIGDLYLLINDFNKPSVTSDEDLTKDATRLDIRHNKLTKFSANEVKNDPMRIPLRRQVRLVGRIRRLGQGVSRINRIIGRVERGIALAR
jgi:RHS repeat-associated protein